MNTRLNLIDIRMGDARDLGEVDRLMSQAFDPRFGEAWTPSQSSGMLSMPGVWLVLASLNGVSAGFAMARAVADDSELLLLAVSPEYRKQGVGGALLRNIIHMARDRGAEKIHLEVRDGNYATVLYQKEGFTKIGERKRYYRGTGKEIFDAHTYAKLLL